MLVYCDPNSINTFGECTIRHVCLFLRDVLRHLQQH